MTNYSETRQSQIYEQLLKSDLLTKKERYNSELLDDLKSFLNTMTESFIKTTSSLSPRDLINLIETKSANVGLGLDEDVLCAISEIIKLSHQIYALESGKRGENRANRVLFGINAPGRVIKNVDLTLNSMPFEIDFVVVNESGIYAIESKHHSREMKIDLNGRLVPNNSDEPNNDTYSSKSISEQMRNQRKALCEAMTTLFPENKKIKFLADNIQSILLTTSDYDIIDESGNETILKCDNIVEYLNSQKSKVKLSKKEIDEICESIEELGQPKLRSVKSRAYDYYCHLAYVFSVAIAKIEFAEECNKQKKTNTIDNTISTSKTKSPWEYIGKVAAVVAVIKAGRMIYKKVVG